MRVRALGSSGLQVSEVILGCGSIGGVGSARATLGHGLTDDEAFHTLHLAAEMGITTLDTANSYASGHSERVVGRWLAGGRGRMQVATKVGSPVQPGQREMDLSRGHILLQIDASLDRLGVDRVDLYLSHGPDDRTPIEETLGAFADLLEMGKVRAIGACNVSAAQLTAMLDAGERHGLPRYACVQNEYNLLTTADEKEVLPLCAHHGIAYLPYSPLCGGILSGKYSAASSPPVGSRVALRPDPYRKHLTQVALAGVGRLAAEARRRGVSSAGLALAWVMSHPHVTAPLIAPRRPEQFAVVGEALSLRLHSEDRDALAALVSATTS